MESIYPRRFNKICPDNFKLEDYNKWAKDNFIPWFIQNNIGQYVINSEWEQALYEEVFIYEDLQK